MTVVKKQITLTAEDAKAMLGKSTALDVLIRANFTPTELGVAAKTRDDLPVIEGYFISHSSRLVPYKSVVPAEDNKNVFAKQRQAMAALAWAQLTIFMENVNGKWEPDWSTDEPKYCVLSKYDNEGKFVLYTDMFTRHQRNFVFKDIQSAKVFMANHEELLKNYFLGL